jgi:hypothetical protein
MKYLETGRISPKRNCTFPQIIRKKVLESKERRRGGGSEGSFFMLEERRMYFQC